MAKDPTLVSHVKEREWTDSIGVGITGLFLIIVCSLLLYLTKYWAVSPGIILLTRVCVGIGVFIGAGLFSYAIYHGLAVRKEQGVGFPCPYCDAVNRLVETPTQDFECEFCNRVIHFQGGQPVPVRTVICKSCKTEHRVAVNVTRYVCDNCNRPLRLSSDPRQKDAEVDKQVADPTSQVYDIYILAIDRKHENEIAQKVQDLLVITLPEARKLLHAASTSEPLAVAFTQTYRKAEAIRRQFQELGATVTMRAVGEEKAVSRK